MSRLGSVLDRRIKPVEYIAYEKEVIPSHLENFIFLQKSLMEQHNYLVSLLPKPKDDWLTKFLKKIFS